MLEWFTRWDLIDAAVLCIGIGLAVRYWQRVSPRRRNPEAERLDALRNLGS